MNTLNSQMCPPDWVPSVGSSTESLMYVPRIACSYPYLSASHNCSLLYFPISLPRFWVSSCPRLLYPSACRWKPRKQKLTNIWWINEWMHKFINELSRDDMSSSFSLRIWIKTQCDDLGKWSSSRLNWETRCFMEEWVIKLSKVIADNSLSITWILHLLRSSASQIISHLKLHPSSSLSTAFGLPISFIHHILRLSFYSTKALFSAHPSVLNYVVSFLNNLGYSSFCSSATK